MACFDEAGDQGNHLGNVPGCAWFVGRWCHSDSGVCVRKDLFVKERVGPPRAALINGLGEDLVVDIGDVPNQGDVKIPVGHPPAQLIENNC